jgi:hypothetical protein
MGTYEFEIPEQRYSEAEQDREKYHAYCQTRINNSWNEGIKDQLNGVIALHIGFTWESIGQLCGYLFGNADEQFKRMIFEHLFTRYHQLDRDMLQQPKPVIHALISDERNASLAAYEGKELSSQLNTMRQAWNDFGVGEYPKTGIITINNGLTWRSIGQILGYLCGNINDSLKNDLFYQMVEEYKRVLEGCRRRLEDEKDADELWFEGEEEIAERIEYEIELLRKQKEEDENAIMSGGF